MTETGTIAVGGENLIDHVTHNDVVSACPGGSPFNVAIALGRQETKVHYISPISTDSWGDLLAETLQKSGVTLSGGRNAAPTTMARVTISEGVPTYQFERDQTAERMVTEDGLERAMPAAASIIHTGSLTLTDGEDAANWEAFCTHSFQQGKLVSLDPNVRLSIITDIETYRDRMLRMVGHVHLLKLSDEDLEGLFPALPQSQALEALLKITSAKLVVLTRGAEGVSAYMRGDELKLPAASLAKLVDTVGAGDTFTATLLAGLIARNADPLAFLSNLTRDELAQLLRRASIAAALNCSREGCNPPSRSEIDTAFF